ncbi:hypothetical protein BDV28DRAFT_151688 [Aspergillus coremiiformis]|uniref:Uncharacterized protein n=1 Tax=Aspergillus coremiiformis TaxID=138285 RepID=A0A5N6YXI4_9EURO|nr:hypothetical protein BDV28DRAFT_151688 [Aspergillus coremiiformis]
MPYYVHIITGDNETHILTTVNRDTADYFYRQLQDHLANSEYAAMKIAYHTPSLWSIDPTLETPNLTLTKLVTDTHRGQNHDIPETAQALLKGKLIITPLSPTLSFHPVSTFHDNSPGNINHRVYHIRNRHRLEWWFVSPNSGSVSVSAVNRSRFRILRLPASAEPLVLVADDLVNLALVEPMNHHRLVTYSFADFRLECPVHVDHQTMPPLAFRFDCLRNGGFSIAAFVGRPEWFVSWSPVDVRTGYGPGEEWLLSSSEGIV